MSSDNLSVAEGHADGEGSDALGSQAGMGEVMLTVKEIAGRLKVSLSKAYALIDAGEIAHYRIGGSIRVSEEQLQEFLDRARQGRRAAREPPATAAKTTTGGFTVLDGERLKDAWKR